MPRKPLAAFVAIATAVLLLWLAAGQQDDTAPRPTVPTDRSSGNTPVGCVTSMLEAAQRGDVQAYLACFTGRLHDVFAERLTKKSAAEASIELKSSVADLKSFVTTDQVVLGDDELELVLERIRTDDNERQRLRLRHVGAVWKIVEITPLERLAPPVRYGTPAGPD